MATHNGLSPEQEQLLRSVPNAVVGTIMPDGQPQLTPNWYLWHDGRFWISTLDWTVKVANVKRDPRVTLCIDPGGRQANYVQVIGRAEIIEGDVREMTLQLIRKYKPLEEAALAHWEQIKADRVLLVVTPHRLQWRFS